VHATGTGSDGSGSWITDPSQPLPGRIGGFITGRSRHICPSGVTVSRVPSPPVFPCRPRTAKPTAASDHTWASPPGNALFDRCATQATTPTRERTGERAGQRGDADQSRRAAQTSSLNGMHPSLPVPEGRPTSVSAGQRPFPWAWLDLNQRPHPYQQSRAERYAASRFCRSRATVGGEVMRS
jgi:hypothetical protein